MTTELEMYEDFEVFGQPFEVTIMLEGEASHDPGCIYGRPEDCYPPESDLDYQITGVSMDTPQDGKYVTVGSFLPGDGSVLDQVFGKYVEEWLGDSRQQDEIFRSFLEIQESQTNPDHEYDYQDRLL